jgi:hypothetical protein
VTQMQQTLLEESQYEVNPSNGKQGVWAKREKRQGKLAFCQRQ